MFEELGRAVLQNFPREVRINLPLDEDGYLDRQCPEARCLLDFKVLFDDWRDKVPDHAFCPLCGKKAGQEDWHTPQQVKHIRDTALRQVTGRIHDALKSGVSQWNRRQEGGGFLQMKMTYKPGPVIPVSPPGLMDLIQSRIECPSCSCRYAVIGAAFFCVACGHHDPDWVLDSSLDAIRKTMASLPEILKSISDKDLSAMAERSWIENSLINVVSSFESWAQHRYSRLDTSRKIRRGAFQNLSAGSELWKSFSGRSFRDHLESDDWSVLRCAFQRRHLFVHRQGIVDADYVEKSGDRTWAEGRRVVLTATEILEYVSIVEKLAKGMKADVAEIVKNGNGSP